MTWKSYAVVSGAGILATYLAAPPWLPPAREAAPASVEAARAAADLPDAEIIREAARLEGRLRAEAEYRAPARDPFQFAARPPADRPQASEPEAAAAPPPAEPEPPLVVLSGIATDIVDGVPERTAILDTASGVVLVRVGDTVAEEYRVREIREDGVDLETIAGGEMRPLRFAPAN